MTKEQGALTPKQKEQQRIAELATKVHPYVLEVFAKWSLPAQELLASELGRFKHGFEEPYHVLKMGNETVWANMHYLITDFMTEAYFNKTDDGEISEVQIENLRRAANEMRSITMAQSGYKLPITEYVENELKDQR